MQIFINFVLSAETKAEAQTKIQALKQALTDANIVPAQIRINVMDRQVIDYSKITVS